MKKCQKFGHYLIHHLICKLIDLLLPYTTDLLLPAALHMEDLRQQALEGAPLQEIITRAEGISEQGEFDMGLIGLWGMTMEAVLKYTVVFVGNNKVLTVRLWRAMIRIQEKIR